ncbi:MAG: alpha/beta hydrolase [Chloroflexi bacterium]|nr:MAG: alpha/beta hydrolase [Chloroflexota bacterium]MBL1197009.1 alpha/beta hydrolase [Chloroflexota bacterium]NOH14304.1 alpha/beta hydrolase [Chloroflexota bacterium]
MSTLTTDQGLVHYEVYGRGKPVILLHGWLGSWGLWQETMSHLSKHYRTYALDFWGFGESGIHNGNGNVRNSYAVGDFVSLVNEFMETLGIAQAPIVGHSMGGTVALSLAVHYPERVSKVAVIGSPINGESLAFMLKLAGVRPLAALAHNTLWALKLGIRAASPVITRDERWAEMISADLSKTSLESFLISIASLRNTDLRPVLGQIRVPSLGMYGDKDIIVNPKQWQPLEEGAPQACIQRYTDAGHFPMLDKPEDFMRDLKEFLDQDESVRAN